MRAVWAYTRLTGERAGVQIYACIAPLDPREAPRLVERAAATSARRASAAAAAVAADERDDVASTTPLLAQRASTVLDVAQAHVAERQPMRALRALRTIYGTSEWTAAHDDFLVRTVLQQLADELPGPHDITADNYERCAARATPHNRADLARRGAAPSKRSASPTHCSRAKSYVCVRRAARRTLTAAPHAQHEALNADARIAFLQERVVARLVGAQQLDAARDFAARHCARNERARALLPAAPARQQQQQQGTPVVPAVAVAPVYQQAQARTPAAPTPTFDVRLLPDVPVYSAIDAFGDAIERARTRGAGRAAPQAAV